MRRILLVGSNLLFATCTLLVIPALLIFGPLSDVKGRRELLTGVIILAAIAAGVFADVTALAMLFVAHKRAQAEGGELRLVIPVTPSCGPYRVK